LKDSVLKQAQATEKKYFPERVRKIKVKKLEDDGVDEVEENE